MLDTQITEPFKLQTNTLSVNRMVLTIEIACKLFAFPIADKILSAIWMLIYERAI